MIIPFLPRSEAYAILEAHYESEAQRGEIEAELGSSLFYSGAPSWEAEAWAREEMKLREVEFNATPEGELHTARIEAAQFVRSAITADMHISGPEDYDGSLIPWGATPVPEYSSHYSRRDFKPAPSSEDIPF